MASLSLWFSTWSSRAGYRCVAYVNELTVGWLDVSYLINETFGVLRPRYGRKLGPLHFICQSTVFALSNRSLSQWRARRADKKSWIIASLCKKIKIKQLAHVGLGRWLVPTNWDTPYTKYSPEGENRQTPMIALPSAESTFGFQELLVRSKRFGHRKTLTSKNTSPTSSSPFEKSGSAGSLDRYRTASTLFELSIDEDSCGTHLIAILDHYRRTNTSVRHQAGSVPRTSSKAFSTIGTNASIINHLCVVLACKEFVLELLLIRVLIEIGMRESGLCCRPLVYLIWTLFQPLVRVRYLYFATGCTLIDIDMVRTMSRRITVRNPWCRSHCDPKSVGIEGERENLIRYLISKCFVDQMV
jgi:hypothetical protein